MAGDRQGGGLVEQRWSVFLSRDRGEFIGRHRGGGGGTRDKHRDKRQTASGKRHFGTRDDGRTTNTALPSWMEKQGWWTARKKRRPVTNQTTYRGRGRFIVPVSDAPE